MHQEMDQSAHCEWIINMVNVFYYKPHSYGVKTLTCLQNVKDMKHNLYLEIYVCILNKVKLAEKSNNSVTGHKFSVSEKLVQHWWKQSNKIKDLPKTKYADHLCIKVKSESLKKICCKRFAMLLKFLWPLQ